MNSRAIIAATLLLAAVTTGTAAPQKSPISFNPVSCIRGGELALLQLNVERKGELRCYFRRMNTTDWCSVEGVNEGPLSRIVLPKFDSGEEIEYFIVLLDGRQVVARSPRIFRASVNNECQAASARHIVRLSMNCGDDGSGIPAAMSVGLKDARPASPSSPAEQ
ncbi:MAG TPA: hypothetical protein VF824_00180 [Thermoanaerobaculia bacterium]|jgi:hypothetical protein